MQSVKWSVSQNMSRMLNDGNFDLNIRSNDERDNEDFKHFKLNINLL